ncbi:MAG: hypothetical protein OCD01_11825 [Fibrobacterales bacterium]
MSYDLNFWKYKKEVYLDNQDVYEKCSEELIVDGLEELPIGAIILKTKEEFKDWIIDDSGVDFENQASDGAFQISTTRQFLRFDCYGMNGSDMNRIIEVMITFDCPLYDPQVPKRYDK